MITTPYKFIGMGYGSSNTAKSSQISLLIEDNFKRTGKKSRLLTFDDGGVLAYQHLAEAGILDLWDVSTPRDGANPEQWFAIGASAWMRHVAQGDWFQVINKQVKVIKGADKDPQYNQCFLEGADAAASKTGAKWIKDGTKVGMDIVAALSTPGFDGAAFAGGNLGMAHYMALQNDFVLHILPKLWSLNYDVFLFTTHEAVSEDKLGLDGKLYGPSIAGKALTGKLAEKLPILLHFERLTAKDKAGVGGLSMDYRAYFVPHQDLGAPLDPKAVWPANHRLPPRAAPKLLEKYPLGYIPLTYDSGLSEFVQTWRSLQESAALKLTPAASPVTPSAPVAAVTVTPTNQVK